MSLSHMIGSADSAPTCAPNREVGKKGRQLLLYLQYQQPYTPWGRAHENSLKTDTISSVASFLQLASVPCPTQLSTICSIVLQVMKVGGAWDHGYGIVNRLFSNQIWPSFGIMFHHLSFLITNTSQTHI